MDREVPPAPPTLNWVSVFNYWKNISDALAGHAQRITDLEAGRYRQKESQMKPFRQGMDLEPGAAAYGRVDSAGRLIEEEPWRPGSGTRPTDPQAGLLDRLSTLERLIDDQGAAIRRIEEAVFGTATGQVRR